MKSKTIAISGIVLVVILFVIKIGLSSYESPNDYHNRGYNSDYKIQIDTLNDSFNVLQNELNHLKYKKETLTSPGSFSSGWNFIALGVKTYKVDNDHQMYLTLNDIGLKLDPLVSKSYLQYFVREGSGYLSTLNFKAGKDYDQIVRVNRKVGYQYDLNRNNIMLPLHSAIAKVLVYIFSAISILTFFWLCLNLIRNLFSFLLDISVNKAFTASNCLRLKTISIILIIFSLTPLLFNLIIYGLFALSYGNNGLVINYSFWSFGYAYLITSVVFYVFFTAFQAGLKLKEENDLTI